MFEHKILRPIDSRVFVLLFTTKNHDETYTIDPLVYLTTNTYLFILLSFGFFKTQTQ